MIRRYIALGEGAGQIIWGLEPLPPDEKDMIVCSWCKQKFVEAHYPMVHDFLLSFDIGTTSEDTGPNTYGYEVENLCKDCAWKLKEKLIELGIEVKETDT